MGLRKFPNCEIWYYQAKIKGKAKAFSTGQTNRKKAEREVPRIEKLITIERSNPHAVDKLSIAIERESEIIKVDVSQSQGIRVGFALRNFLKFAGDIKLSKIDALMIEDFQRKRLAEAASNTVSCELNYLFRMLKRHGYNDIKKPSSKRGKRTEVKHLNKDELDRFFEACPDRLRLVYLVMFATGARLAEIVPSSRSSHRSLKKSDVDLENRMIRLRLAKQRLEKSSIKPKMIFKPICQELVALLREQMASVEGDYVFEPGGVTKVL